MASRLNFIKWWILFFKKIKFINYLKKNIKDRFFEYVFINIGEIIRIIILEKPSLMKTRVSIKIKKLGTFIKDYFLRDREKLNQFSLENLLPKV